MCILTAIIFSCALVTVDASLYDFTKVGECILGYNPWFELLRHGCYCGFGNHGKVKPEDPYDACCQKHDDCYGKLTDEEPKKCPNLLAEYLTPYWFECRSHHAYCYVDPPYSWFPWWQTCGVGLCECDSEMMECWKNVTKHSNDTRGKPDKRYCRQNESTLPHLQEPTWFDYFESLITFYADLNRHNYEEAEKAKKIKKWEEDRLNAIYEWGKGYRRTPIREHEPDVNDIPHPPYSWPKHYPNQLPQAPPPHLPWRQEQEPHPRDWNSPNFVNNF